VATKQVGVKDDKRRCSHGIISFHSRKLEKSLVKYFRVDCEFEFENLIGNGLINNSDVQMLLVSEVKVAGTCW
jgi:hypothetical protein